MVNAMLLAAGLGTRLRPLTDDTPKPLINVGGEPVILRSLHALKEAGVKRTVINTHYLAPQIERTVKAATQNWPMQVLFSYEKELLETGGGLKKALPFLGDAPFLVVNSDAVWDDTAAPLLRPLLKKFDVTKHDVLMAVVKENTVRDFRQEGGDFRLTKASPKFTRPVNRDQCNVVYAGIHITHPAFIAFEAAQKFSLVKPWQEALAQGRLHGWLYPEKWIDMGTHVGLQVARDWVAETRRHREED
ncbi:MAG: mannose-1-phosphate guanylyltransferase [Alphaproteobacteria bacterium CG_4_10_14_0_8_um_filter_53_9]|nr:MAG: mannose-1-phosphate guanylyltransferase [Alphaproteobacteria bacterium CG_4_10_14_0_8_um_filter_53_9]